MRARTTGAAASWVGGWRRVRGFSAAIAAGFVIAMVFANRPGEAANEVFTYDSAGRLISVDHGDGRVTTYTLDPAGNRNALETASGAAPPATLTVPATSTTGSYSVSWTASATPGVTAYRLWEANNAAFSSETQVHNGASPASISGRTDGTYYYRVQACVGAVCGAYRVGSNATTVGMPPAAPATINAPATNFTGAYTVSWTAPASGTVTRYEVQEATNASFTSPLDIFNNSGTSTNVTGRLAGTTYYYRVRACNSVTCGPYTTSSGTAVMAVGAPATINAPATNFTGAYTVSWTAPTSGTATSYELQEATDASFTAPLNIPSSGTSASITGRLTGTTYYYRVRACNALGCGPYTASSGTAMTLVPPTPASISNPNNDADGTYDVSWAAVTGPVTRYELWEADNSSYLGETRVHNALGLVANLTGRTSGTSYYYRVRACNAAGCSGYLAGTSPTNIFVAPGAPTSLTIPAASSTGTYTISWSAPAIGPTPPQYYYYQLFESTNNTTWSGPPVFQGITLSTQLTGRTSGTYYYRVQACNGPNCGEFRGSPQGIVVATPPGAPASITFTSPDYDGSYTISWAAVSGTVTAYEVQEATNSSFTGAIPIYGSTGTSTNVTGRASGSYFYRVRACNGAACSGYTQGSGAMSVQIIPNAPASINAPANNFTGAYTISWTAPTSGTTTGYELQEATNASFTSPLDIFSGSATSTNVTGRLSATTYYYRVRACNGGGCGPYTASTGTLVTTVPPTPASISNPNNDADGTYDVSWATVSGPVTNYELWEADNSSHLGEIRVHNEIASVANRTGRVNGTAYYYRVRACNAAGCGGFLASTNATTIFVPPGAPSSLTIPTTSSTGSYTISWAAPTTGTVQYYELYESTSTTFSGPPIFQGITLSTPISGRTNGTYYYRVRACNGPNCGAYRESPQGIVVATPPSVPSSLSVQSPSSGSIALSWGSSTGTITAYEVHEATNPGFSGAIPIYGSTGTSTSVGGRVNGTYYYRVRACNGASNCSDWRAGSNTAVVVIPPPSLTVPATSTNGSYTLSWAGAGGAFDRYEIYKATNPSFSGESIIYSSLGTSQTFSGEVGGTYYFRIRVCTSGFCSAMTQGGNSLLIAYPPGAPPLSIQENPNWDNDGNYSIAWGTAGFINAFYQLFEANNPSFAGETKVYEGSEQSVNLTNRGEGDYYYRVRACNLWPTNCGPFRTRTNVLRVAFPPQPPSFLTVPATSSGTHTLTWGAPSNHYDGFAIEESLSAGFTNSTFINPGNNLSITLTGRQTGTYYYRIQSLWSVGGGSSSWVTGANPTVVNTPPPIPNVPDGIWTTPNTGNPRTFTVHWGASPAGGAAVHHYTLRENSGIPPSGPPVDTNMGTSLSRTYTKPNSYSEWSYLVRACATADESACSGFTTGTPRIVCPSTGCP